MGGRRSSSGEGGSRASGNMAVASVGEGGVEGDGAAVSGTAGAADFVLDLLRRLRRIIEPTDPSLTPPAV